MVLSDIDQPNQVPHIIGLLGIDLVQDEVQVINGSRLRAIVDRRPFAGGLFPFTPLRPMLIANLGREQDTEAAAILLSPLFPVDHPVRVICQSDLSRVVEATIASLSGLPEASAIFVPASDPLTAGADPCAFQHIVARLRDIDGCPWDRKQTHGSLRDSFIDEVYEVVDAIDAHDPANLAEELGDLFLLIMMHAQIAAESGEFTIEQVYRDVATKIVGRHPHVFGDVEITRPADLMRIWNNAKARERADRPGNGGAKAVDGEPHSMPALTRAVRVLRKHPRVPAESEEATDPGERLLELIHDITANGDDPEDLLRAALTRHVQLAARPTDERHR